MENEDVNEYSQLIKLSGSNYEMAEGEPDVKGWAIRDNLGAKLGKVEELLFNPASQKVRYLIAHLEERVFGVENRKTLIPVGLAELHESDDDVYLPDITIEQLASSPYYQGDPVSYAYESSVRDAFQTRNFDDAEVYDEQTFYEHDHYNERNFFGRRFQEKNTPGQSPT